MRLYLKCIKLAFHKMIAYKAEAVYIIINKIILFLVQLSLWNALYSNRSSIQGITGNVTRQEITTYIIINIILSIVIENTVIRFINNKVRTGEIAMDMMKPMRFKLFVMAVTTGENLFKFFFNLIPVLVICILFTPIDVPDLLSLLVSLAFFVLAACLYFQITYIFGLLAFWYMNIWQLEFLLDGLITLFSGFWIPLWFFPETLYNVILYLPFKLIYYVPSAVYLNKITLDAALPFLVQYVFWIALLIITEKVLWKRCKQKLIIQGG